MSTKQPKYKKWIFPLIGLSVLFFLIIITAVLIAFKVADKRLEVVASTIEEMGEQHITANVALNTNLPLNSVLQVNDDVMVGINMVVETEIPVHVVIPVNEDILVPVAGDIPVSITIPVDIPLSETDLAPYFIKIAKELRG